MKVFLVVGTLFPYERLVKEIDQWVHSRNDAQVIGRILAIVATSLSILNIIKR